MTIKDGVSLITLMSSREERNRKRKSPYLDLCILLSSEFERSLLYLGRADLSRRSLETLEPYFIRTILEDQDCFRSQAQAEALLAIMPGDGASASEPVASTLSTSYTY